MTEINQNKRPLEAERVFKNYAQLENNQLFQSLVSTVYSAELWTALNQVVAKYNLSPMIPIDLFMHEDPAVNYLPEKKNLSGSVFITAFLERGIHLEIYFSFSIYDGRNRAVYILNGQMHTSSEALLEYLQSDRFAAMQFPLGYFYVKQTQGNQ